MAIASARVSNGTSVRRNLLPPTRKRTLPCDSRTRTSRHETHARLSHAPCRTIAFRALLLADKVERRKAQLRNRPGPSESRVQYATLKVLIRRSLASHEVPNSAGHNDARYDLRPAAGECEPHKRINQKEDPSDFEHVVRSFVAKNFQRIWPPVTIGVMFVRASFITASQAGHDGGVRTADFYRAISAEAARRARATSSVMMQQANLARALRRQSALSGSRPRRSETNMHWLRLAVPATISSRLGMLSMKMGGQS
jgi:hypothetical protein